MFGGLKGSRRESFVSLEKSKELKHAKQAACSDTHACTRARVSARTSETENMRLRSV